MNIRQNKIQCDENCYSLSKFKAQLLQSEKEINFLAIAFEMKEITESYFYKNMVYCYSGRIGSLFMVRKQLRKKYCFSLDPNMLDC